MDSQQQPPPLAPPSVPPRPSRVKANASGGAAATHVEAASSGNATAAAPTGVPVIPPRPARNKSPLPATATTTQPEEVEHISPAAASAAPPLPARQHSPPPPKGETDSTSQVPESQTVTVPVDMQVHAPIASTNLPGSRPGFLRSTTLGTSTPPRVPAKITNDSGIPEIGRQVPMYPNAGDVQAPTPTPSRQNPAIPAHQKRLPGSASPYHVKKEDYGEYGSGLHPLDRRSGHYSLSSEDLNYIVEQTGKVPQSTGVPDEELGYIATEEFAKHLGSATPRETPREELTESEAHKLSRVNTTESTHNREGNHSPEITIHVEPRAHQRSGSHPYGKQYNTHGRYSQSQTTLAVGAASEGGAAAETNIPEEECGEKDGEFRDEIHYHGTPILASDEVHKKGTSTPHLVPAISPPLVPRRTTSRPVSRAPSRPPSRGSMKEPKSATELVPDSHIQHTPLDQVEEHEPLFPDDDDVGKDKDAALREGVARALGADRSTSTASRSSRKFPSNDLWEDAPPSSHLEATVTSPPPGLTPLSGENNDGKAVEQSGDIGEEPQDEESDRLGVPNRHKKGSPTSEEQQKPSRPSLPAKTASGKQRFPSRDIWEEAPDSAQLTATVSPALSVTEEDISSPVDTNAVLLNFPTAGEGVVSTRATTSAPLEDTPSDDRVSTGAPIEGSSQTLKKPEVPERPASPEKNEKWAPTGAMPIMPTIPANRPARVAGTPNKLDTQEQVEQAQRPSTVPRTNSPEEKKSPPAIPERPKPTIPQRPVRATGVLKTNPFQQVQVPPSDDSATSPTKSPPPVKPKPAIGGKIAALRANLELEKRLAAGPGGFIKKQDEEKKNEKAEEGKKEDEEPQVAQPLVGVTKGRAKGPRGRKLPTANAPTASTATSEEDKTSEPSLGFAISTVWTLDDEYEARVVLVDPAEKPQVGEHAEKPNLEAQENLAKEVLTEMLDPPIVVEVPTSSAAKVDHSEEYPAGMISEAEHPEDAAPKGASSLDTNEPAKTPAVAESVAASGDTAEEEGDGDWDVVSKV